MILLVSWREKQMYSVRKSVMILHACEMQFIINKSGDVVQELMSFGVWNRAKHIHL